MFLIVIVRLIVKLTHGKNRQDTSDIDRLNSMIDEKRIQNDEKYHDYINKVDELITLENYSEALELSLETLKLKPKAYLPSHHLGIIYYHLGEYNHALKFLTEAIEQKNYAVDYLYKGRCFSALNSHKKAIKCLENARLFHSGHSSTLYKELAYLYHLVGNEKKSDYYYHL